MRFKDISVSFVVTVLTTGLLGAVLTELVFPPLSVALRIGLYRPFVFLLS
ncbi:hypothetical protein ABEY41_00215 [Peribacillus butanolivorans]